MGRECKGASILPAPAPEKHVQGVQGRWPVPAPAHQKSARAPASARTSAGKARARSAEAARSSARTSAGRARARSGGGTRLCPHQRQKSQCKECGGAGLPAPAPEGPVQGVRRRQGPLPAPAPEEQVQGMRAQRPGGRRRRLKVGAAARGRRPRRRGATRRSARAARGTQRRKVGCAPARCSCIPWCGKCVCVCVACVCVCVCVDLAPFLASQRAGDAPAGAVQHENSASASSGVKPDPENLPPYDYAPFFAGAVHHAGAPRPPAAPSAARLDAPPPTPRHPPRARPVQCNVHNLGASLLRRTGCSSSRRDHRAYIP